jgi:hypothetical protein
MADITLDADTFCRYRDNPWDERAFALKTREVLELRYRDVTRLPELLDAFETRNRDDHVGLCLTRIAANDRTLRAALAAAGYDTVENSYDLSLSSLAAFYPVNGFGRVLPLRDAVAADIPLLQIIAAEDFTYGRFAEDSRIPPAACAERQRNWIADMAADKNFTIWVTGPVGAPTGFHAFRRQGTHANMILTGMARAHQPLAGFFWASCLHDTAKAGMTTVSTMISAANIPAVNLYARLGFRFDRLWTGMHKHILKGVKIGHENAPAA